MILPQQAYPPDMGMPEDGTGPAPPLFQQPSPWQQAPPPPIEPYLPVLKEPSKAFQDEAFEFFAAFGKYSADYVRVKVADLELWRHLYWGDIGFKEWAKWNYLSPTLSRSRRSRRYRYNDEAASDGLSDYIHPVGPACDSHMVNSFNAIFAGPQWLTIESQRDTTNLSQPADIPVAHVMQELMLSMLKLGRIKENVAAALLDWIVLGTVCVKTTWYRHKIQRWRWNTATGQQETYSDTAWECPVIEPIPLDMWLPDPQALGTNVQTWRAIGNRVIREYTEVDALFKQGVYKLNYKEFRERFEDQQTTTQSIEASDLSVDPEAYQYYLNPLSNIKLWEIHGRVPSKKDGPTECCCTIATELGAESPQGGVLIRLTTVPILQSGYRPYTVGHYIPQPGAYGRGMIERSEKLQGILSQFIGQLQDVARRTACAAYLAREGTGAGDKAQESKGPKPGEIWTTDDPQRDIVAFPNPQSETGAINNIISVLLPEFRMGSATLQFQGAGNDSTATEAAINQRQTQAPNAALTDLFVENVLEPAVNIAIKMLEQFSDKHREIKIRDTDGNEQVVTLSPEDIQQGDWIGRVVLTNQDASSVARAQSIERFFPVAMNLSQPLQQEGKRISLSELVQRYLDALNVTGSDRIIQVIGTREQMMQQQMQQLAMQNQQMATVLQQGPGAGSQPQNSSLPQGPPGPSPPPQEPQQIPIPLVQNGGPMGPEPTDENAIAQLMQFQAQQGMGNGDAS